MPYLLSQRALQVGLSQGGGCSGRRNTNAKRCHIADYEAGNEQIHKVEHKMVDVVCELLRVALADGIIAQRSC